jgi:Asp-tRNA(Asn)/Glu-tRNA(Gln) amidotransferase A subunit family amidase
MAGLPTAVQVVGRRWQEEQVLGYMSVVEEALEAYQDPTTGASSRYQLLEID